MVCSRCGCEQVGGGQFCRQCGAQVAATPQQHHAQQKDAPPQNWPPPPAPAYYADPYAAANFATPEQRMRVQQNLQPLAIAWLIYGAYRLMIGLVAGFTLHTLARSGMFSLGETPSFVPSLLGHIAPIIAVTSAFMALLALFTGFSLLTRKPWARVLAIVIGILSLIKIPFGTALGIYTLWVLAPRVSGDEWQRIQLQTPTGV